MVVIVQSFLYAALSPSFVFKCNNKDYYIKTLYNKVQSGEQALDEILERKLFKLSTLYFQITRKNKFQRFQISF